MSELLSKFKILEHTGDIGLQIWSPSLEGIFSISAEALFSLITDLHSITPKEKIEISLYAESDPDLLVRWLNHLNFLFSTDGILVCQVDIFSIDAGWLYASVFGEFFKPDKHVIDREIKAVTYHQLTLERRNKNWFAQVIFDI